MDNVYPAARADEDEATLEVTPTMSRCHINSCMVLFRGLDKVWE